MSESADEIRALERELADLRDLRVATQRRVAERGVLSLGVERTARDRSTMTSPEIEQAEAQVQSLYDRLVTSWDEVDSIRVMRDRIKRRASHLTDLNPSNRILAAEAALRARLAVEAEAAGIRLDVTMPISVDLDEGAS